VNTVFENNNGKKLRGVNLGGWLVIEKWMVPSLFEGLQAKDETSFCVELGERAEPTLKRHWNTFITEADFAWLSKVGINAVRIPVGHWLFGPDYPYHRAYGYNRYPFAVGGLDVLDQAFDWAERHGLLIVLDLHAAPGCQNGFDNGGIQDVCEWHTQDEYLEHTLTVLEWLAERYRGRPALHGIQTLNEPRGDIATDYLKAFNLEAYRRIRKHCLPEHVAVVFHDGFRSFREYSGFLTEPEYRNVVLDIHRYQCFVQEDISLDIYGHIRKSVTDWREEADAIIQDRGPRAYVGEWSLGLDLHTFPLPNLDGFQTKVAIAAHAAAQLTVFENYLGWFFWSYKTETAPNWCFRECVERGWLPGDFR